MGLNLLTSETSKYHIQIEWSWLTQIITQFSHFDKTKSLLFNNPFFNNPDSLIIEYSRTDQYLNLLDDDFRDWIKSQYSFLSSTSETETFFSRIQKSAHLSISELNKVVRFIEISKEITKNSPPISPSEIENLKKINIHLEFQSLLKEFRHLIDLDGSINFDKSPELSEMFTRLRDLEDRLRKTILEILRSPTINKLLQFENFDIIYDRFVIPIRSDSYRSDIGVIISKSETGQTLFVEPFELRDLSNKRLELVAKIDEFISKLAEKFSKKLSEKSDHLQVIYENIILIDLYITKVNFSLSYKLSAPIISENTGFHFDSLFHPLIKNCVKNNVTCDENVKGIIISGPNTGGKTVFLKSIALSYLLFYHGFHVPALHATMYPYKGIFYFGNDLQDLSHGLSSFSGEVKNYLNLLNEAQESNLVLIDEIFNSTSSDEASALSLAYFNELHEIGKCHIIVSTHHQMFKTLVHQNNDYHSCHVGFDTDGLKPTYKINWGTPGSSMAIEIFKILAKDFIFHEKIANNAINLLSQKNVSYETLLQKVTQKQIQLDKLILSNQNLEVELKNQKGAMEGVLHLKLHEELSKTKREMDKIIEQAKSLLVQVQNQEISKVKKIDEKHHQLNNLISEFQPKSKNEIPQALPKGNIQIHLLKVGDNVFSHQFKKNFTVVSIDKKKSEVQIGKGSFKISVPANSLSYSNQPEVRFRVEVSISKREHAPLEIDARGMRLSEFQNQVDMALGDLLSGDLPFLNIIHGHGDGILKNWLRNFLKQSKEFQGESPDNGNDGETKITLKI